MPPLSQLPLFSFNTLELKVEIFCVAFLFCCMSPTALQDMVHDYICINSLTKYLNVPKTTVEANARDGDENEDGDEKMVALDETSCLMMLDIQTGSGLETSAQNK